MVECSYVLCELLVKLHSDILAGVLEGALGCLSIAGLAYLRWIIYK